MRFQQSFMSTEALYNVTVHAVYNQGYETLLRRG
jgi:hypothetical protein